MSSRVVCLRGFAALPIELFHIILSFMQEPSIPHRSRYAMGSVYRERRDVLRALCQLCHSLRRTLLPLLWERLETCAFSTFAEPEWVDDKRTVVLGRELMGQLRLVNDCKQSYGSYVRCDLSDGPSTS